MLPKFEHPILQIIVPSTGARLKFRPMLVKEEKLLLLAKESTDPEDMLLAIKQVINNCAVDPIQIDKLAMFDVEWLFVKIRAQSISPVIRQTYEDREDGQEYQLNIDLNSIEMPNCQGINRDIDLGNNLGFLRLRFPPATLYSTKKTESDILFECAEAIYNGETCTPINNKEEFDAWYETLPVPVSNQIDEFFTKIPTMKLDLRYTNSKGSERKIELRTLSDFFDLR